MDNITQFHIQHKYIVKIDILKTRPGCIAHFPINRFTRTSSIDRTYVLYTDPYAIEIFTVYNNEKPVSHVVEAVVTNIRLLIIQDIFLITHRLGMSKDLIVTSSGQTLFKMLEIPMTEEEKKKETELCTAFREMLAGNTVVRDVEGYAQVLSCFENGGL